jgi:hypothetical protein
VRKSRIVGHLEVTAAKRIEPLWRLWQSRLRLARYWQGALRDLPHGPLGDGFERVPFRTD